jgi:elongation factor G
MTAPSPFPSPSPGPASIPPLARLRNLGVVAHIDAGKTTVSERILFYTGVEHKMGEVDEGTTVMDWMPEERERGISITAAATTIPWRGHTLNLVDTPGHVDFTVEVERCLRVLDGAILVIDAVAGVQAQSETVWRQMRRHGVPSLCFVNKCDRPGADFLAALGSLKKRLGAHAVPLQYPLFREGQLRGVVDLFSRRALEFPSPGEDPRAALRELDLPAELRDEIEVLRSDLVDALAELDDGLLSAVLEDRDPDVPTLRSALRQGTLAGKLVPVLCGAALRNIGIQPLLDAVVDYLPSPLDLPPVAGRDPRTGESVERAPDPDAPPCALAFKLHADAHGDLTFVRVYSGRIRSGDELFNARVQRNERASRLLRMHADARHIVDSAGPGEIVAIMGLKFTATGDTLSTHDAPILLEPPAFPEPVISLVVEPRSTAERDKLRLALRRLAHEDPSFREREDETTGQWLVAGMGELHLEVMLHRLRSEHHLDVNTGAPRVAYREAVREIGRGSGRVERALGGKEVFGQIDLELRPATADPGDRAGPESAGPTPHRPDLHAIAIQWVDGCAVPAAFRSAVAEALVLSAQVGPRFGFPLVQALIRVTGGQSHPRTDAESGFVQAATIALRQAMTAARIDLLEPVMSFEIEAPAEFSSGILGDLNSRRAEVTGVVARGVLRAITGTVPLVHMFGYSTVVRSLSQGRASFSMQPAGFRGVPEGELRQRGLTWD